MSKQSYTLKFTSNPGGRNFISRPFCHATLHPDASCLLHRDRGVNKGLAYLLHAAAILPSIFAVLLLAAQSACIPFHFQIYAWMHVLFLDESLPD